MAAGARERRRAPTSGWRSRASPDRAAGRRRSRSARSGSRWTSTATLDTRLLRLWGDRDEIRQRAAQWTMELLEAARSRQPGRGARPTRLRRRSSSALPLHPVAVTANIQDHGSTQPTTISIRPATARTPTTRLARADGDEAADSSELRAGRRRGRDDRRRPRRRARAQARRAAGQVPPPRRRVRQLSQADDQGAHRARTRARRPTSSSSCSTRSTTSRASRTSIPPTVDPATVVQGVEMVEKKLLKALAAAGLEIVDPVEPDLRPAAARGGGDRAGAVARGRPRRRRASIRSGYLFNGQLLRPARVVVKQWNG